MNPTQPDSARRNEIESKVISQFGDQWTRFTENEGYYGSNALLEDLIGQVLPVEKVRGATVAEIGSGSGRIVLMLAGAGAGKIVAIEPSDAMGPLKENTRHLGGLVLPIQEKGDEWTYPELDYVFSIGVLHHIFQPDPVVQNAYKNLKSGGEMVIWVYGYEGNELYLSFVEPLRAITTRIPHLLMNPITWILLPLLILYANLCRWLPLPMAKYMTGHILKLTPSVQRLTIYDQLKPTWSKYYRRDEAESLLSRNGFKDVVSAHRHGYSWIVKGRKP